MADLIVRNTDGREITRFELCEGDPPIPIDGVQAKVDEFDDIILTVAFDTTEAA